VVHQVLTYFISLAKLQCNSCGEVLENSTSGAGARDFQIQPNPSIREDLSEPYFGIKGILAVLIPGDQVLFRWADFEFRQPAQSEELLQSHDQSCRLQKGPVTRIFGHLDRSNRSSGYGMFVAEITPPSALRTLRYGEPWLY
jgi:hypothetical protein